MNLLIGAGHIEARYYPLGLLYDESAFVEERENGKLVTESQLVRLAIHSLMSKKAGNEFSKLTKQLNVEVTPLPGMFSDYLAGDENDAEPG